MRIIKRAQPSKALRRVLDKNGVIRSLMSQEIILFLFFEVFEKKEQNTISTCVRFATARVSAASVDIRKRSSSSSSSSESPAFLRCCFCCCCCCCSLSLFVSVGPWLVSCTAPHRQKHQQKQKHHQQQQQQQVSLSPSDHGPVQRIILCVGAPEDHHHPHHFGGEPPQGRVSFFSAHHHHYHLIINIEVAAAAVVAISSQLVSVLHQQQSKCVCVCVFGWLVGSPLLCLLSKCCFGCSTGCVTSDCDESDKATAPRDHPPPSSTRIISRPPLLLLLPLLFHYLPRCFGSTLLRILSLSKFCCLDCVPSFSEL